MKKVTCVHQIQLQCSEKKPEFSTIPNSTCPLGPVLEGCILQKFHYCSGVDFFWNRGVHGFSHGFSNVMFSTGLSQIFSFRGGRGPQNRSMEVIVGAHQLAHTITDTSGSDGEDTPAVHALVIPVAMRSAIATSNP